MPRVNGKNMHDILTGSIPTPAHTPYEPEDGDEVGGEGGAIYTGEGSTTTFKRRTIHQNNIADNGGGALWNEGTTMLMSNGFLKGNSAKVRGLEVEACATLAETTRGE